MSLNNSAITQSVGVPYQQYVTSSAGHTFVSSSTYFNDTSDNIPRYKDADGTIFDVIISSSYALTASHALNSGEDAFPFTGDASITGSLTISGSFNAFRLNTTDVILGEGAGALSTINGPRNVFVGYQSGYSNTNGDDNVAIGYQAGYGLHNNASDSNVFVGKLAGGGGTSGAARMSDANSNVGVGSQALLYLSTGDSNIAIGAAAMRGSGAAMSATQNIALGVSALFKTDSGDNNIGIGYNAGLDQTTGDGNITIGSGSLGIAGESNQLRIGNGNSLVTISASLETGEILLNTTTISGSLLNTGTVSIDHTDSPYTLTGTQQFVLIDPLTSDVIVNLPDAATYPGREIKLKLTQNSGANTVTLQCQGADTIDGAASNTTALEDQYEAISIVSNGGTSWFIF